MAGRCTTICMIYSCCYTEAIPSLLTGTEQMCSVFFKDYMFFLHVSRIENLSKISIPAKYFVGISLIYTNLFVSTTLIVLYKGSCSLERVCFEA